MTPFVRAYRLFLRFLSAGSFLTRRFIARTARTNPVDGVELCLDVGAGTAPYRQEISRHFAVGHYIALDFTASDVVDVVADVHALPIGVQSIDLVVCFEVIQHVAQYHKVLDELIRVLRPGGRIIISFPFMYPECAVVDFRRWTLAGMKQELEDRGFAVLAAARQGGAAFSIISLVIWALNHIVPGSRTTWRSPRTPGGYFRQGLRVLLSLPFVLLSWLAVALDVLFPSYGCYRGALIFARLDRGVASRFGPDKLDVSP